MDNRDMLASNVEWIRHTARMFIKEDDHADDLASETIERALNSIESFSGGNHKMRDWLFVIMKHVYYRGRSKSKKEKEMFTSWEDVSYSDDFEDNESMGPVDSLEDQMNVDAIMSCIDKLPKIYREILKLKAEEFSDPEIAAILDINAGTVKSRLSRGREMLREKLTNNGFFNESGDK